MYLQRWVWGSWWCSVANKRRADSCWAVACTPPAPTATRNKDPWNWDTASWWWTACTAGWHPTGSPHSPCLCTARSATFRDTRETHDTSVTKRRQRRNKRRAPVWNGRISHFTKGQREKEKKETNEKLSRLRWCDILAVWGTASF